jgi:hypothetical protein
LNVDIFDLVPALQTAQKTVAIKPENDVFAVFRFFAFGRGVVHIHTNKKVGL